MNSGIREVRMKKPVRIWNLVNQKLNIKYHIILHFVLSILVRDDEEIWWMNYKTKQDRDKTRE